MKLEFGDLYKFVVSVGIALISLAFIVPWLFLKEPFDLFKTKEELTHISAVARIAIQHRQEAVDVISKCAPWFALTSFGAGTLMVFFGLRGWYANQLLLDERARIEVQLARLSLRDSTSDEIEDIAERDFEAQVETSARTVTASNAFQRSYLDIEDQVAQAFTSAYAAKYDVERQKIIGGVHVDLLLRGRAKLSKDVLVEVKWIRSGFNYGWLRESFLRNLYAKNIYSQVTNRIPNTLLLVVTEFEVKESEKYSSLLVRIGREELARQGKDRVIMMARKELISLSNEALRDRLGL